MPHQRCPLVVHLALCLFALLPVAGAVQPGSTPPRPRIIGLAGAAFYFHDIAGTRAFYKDFLGYAEPRKFSSAEGQGKTWIKINDAQQVELIPEMESGSDRLFRVVLLTDDAVGLHAYLAAVGVKIPDQVSIGEDGDLGFTVRDPEGRSIGIVQHLPDGWVMKGKGLDLPVTRIAPRIRHAGFMVGDLGAAMGFYRDILGFEEVWRGSANDRVLSWVNLKVPDGDEYLELMLFDPASPPTSERIRTMNHICLEVGEAAAAERTLRTRTLPAGCKAISAIRTGVNGKQQINCFDPDGTRVELMEPIAVDGKPRPSSSAPPPGRN